jgi:hypothetical protein
LHIASPAQELLKISTPTAFSTFSFKDFIPIPLDPSASGIGIIAGYASVENSAIVAA